MLKETFVKRAEVADAHIAITDGMFLAVLFVIGGQVKEYLGQEPVGNTGLFDELGEFAFLGAEKTTVEGLVNIYKYLRKTIPERLGGCTAGLACVQGTSIFFH
jgi:hypothetical protein